MNLKGRSFNSEKQMEIIFVTLILALSFSALFAMLMQRGNKENNSALAVFFLSIPLWMAALFLYYYLSLIVKLLIAG